RKLPLLARLRLPARRRLLLPRLPPLLTLSRTRPLLRPVQLRSARVPRLRAPAPARNRSLRRLPAALRTPRVRRPWRRPPTTCSASPRAVQRRLSPLRRGTDGSASPRLRSPRPSPRLPQCRLAALSTSMTCSRTDLDHDR